MALKKIALVSCAHCSKLKSAHEVCKYCGYYNGKEVINVISKELKKKEKQLKAQKK